MPTYCLNPGCHVIHYPDTCAAFPPSLEPFLTDMEPSFRNLLGRVQHGRNPEMILEAFIRELKAPSPQYKVPQWQVYKFGPGKWPYGKWVLDRLAWFIKDPKKLLHALAQLEQQSEREKQARNREADTLTLTLPGSDFADT
jgi:hypothetical protein